MLKHCQGELQDRLCAFRCHLASKGSLRPAASQYDVHAQEGIACVQLPKGAVASSAVAAAAIIAAAAVVLHGFHLLGCAGQHLWRKLQEA
jgi:hypothetical protein